MTLTIIITCFLPGIAAIIRWRVWQARNTLALVEATLRFNATGNTVTPLVQRLVFQAGPAACKNVKREMMDAMAKSRHPRNNLNTGQETIAQLENLGGGSNRGEGVKTQ